MSYQEQTKEKLIDIIGALEADIEFMEAEEKGYLIQIKNLEVDVSSLEDKNEALQTDLDDANSELEDLEDDAKSYKKLSSNLRDELKIDYLAEYYDIITIEDLEKIVESK